MYALAEVLCKTLGELGEMPYGEFMGWVAHFRRKERDKR